MSINQLNRVQIKAEILTVLAKLQTNPEVANVDELLKVLEQQNDKNIILNILIKELTKANEQKVILTSFLALKLCNKNDFESALWEVLKDSSVADSTKTIILNILKDMGNKINYENLEEYFENPTEVIDADTKKLLETAIINPEAQIDFLDFLNSLSDTDKKILIKSMGEDYSSDDLANILNPLALHEPDSDIGKMAIDILGITKSQLALHTLLNLLDFVEDENIISLIKKNISKLKISGIREDNANEFYANMLASKPYSSYASFPDGHGNQALIFSREWQNETVQIIAVVINDTSGIIDCFGFNEISKLEFERIVKRFYQGDEHIYLNSSIMKTLLLNAEKLTHKQKRLLPYEYICWKTLLADITPESVPIELTLKSLFINKDLSEADLKKVYMFDFIQRWFFDIDYNDNFRLLISNLNTKIIKNDFNFNLDTLINENLNKIFSSEQKNLLDKRILISSYLKYLAGINEDAGILYSLYFSEVAKEQLSVNIIKKSIYEYYVMLKFKYKEEHKMTNIFALKNKPQKLELTKKQIDCVISIIEKLWVK
jgi:DNA-directed RNA polymerase specialized sigma24 family protein